MNMMELETTLAGFSVQSSALTIVYSGYEASVQYIEQQLSSEPDLRVFRSNFSYMYWNIDYNNTAASLVAPYTLSFALGTDYRVMWGSPNGTAVGAPLCTITGSGCNDSDYVSMFANDANFLLVDCSLGSIAVVLRNSYCTWYEKAVTAARCKILSKS